jgi:hypothetical protein
MEKLKQLIKESFEMRVKMRWLREIERATDRYKKTYAKAAREHAVMQALIKEYNKLYSDNLGGDRYV